MDKRLSKGNKENVQAIERAGTQTARSTVLHIEDNPVNLRLMRQVFLIRKDLELREAETAEIGIEMARAAPPALILMDISLPGMDGYVALSALQSRCAHRPRPRHRHLGQCHEG